MADLLEPLQPIADIIGPAAITADYSDTQFFRNGTYAAGWQVSVNGDYKGAHIKFSNKARTLKEAAELTLAELKGALGL